MTFSSRLAELKDKGFFENVEITRGIEKESLRVNQNARLSESDHPKGLGSPLTNKFITTDFSEALIELVTPTFNSVDEVYEFLLDLHIFAANAMESDEILWTNSMPCFIRDESEIRIAEFGSSNIGKLKNIYRKGLRVRYGSIMQCVAGIHYNFSFDNDSLRLLLKILTKN
jgi:Gamma-glutamylcysteine synthetase